jgi:hypothetical protein
MTSPTMGFGETQAMQKRVSGTVCGVLALLGLLVMVTPYVAGAAAPTELAQKDAKSDGKEGSGLTRAALGF